MQKTVSLRTLLVLLNLSAFLSGCGTLIGNVKPIEEKSDGYGILDLSKKTGWDKLEPESNELKNGEASSSLPSQIPDAAYQSKKTNSIISITSGCRKYVGDRSLKELTQITTLGISNREIIDETTITISNIGALRTTIKGDVPSDGSDSLKENIMLRVVVLKNDNCTFNLMYLARPENFESEENDFTEFLNSFRLASNNS